MRTVRVMHSPTACFQRTTMNIGGHGGRRGNYRTAWFLHTIAGFSVCRRLGESSAEGKISLHAKKFAHSAKRQTCTCISGDTDEGATTPRRAGADSHARNQSSAIAEVLLLRVDLVQDRQVHVRER